MSCALFLISVAVCVAVGVAVGAAVGVAVEWYWSFLHRCGFDLRLRLRLRLVAVAVAVAVEIFDRISGPELNVHRMIGNLNSTRYRNILFVFCFLS